MAWKPSSMDWKPATAIDGPATIYVRASDHDYAMICDLIQIMLKETKLADRVTLERNQKAGD